MRTSATGVNQMRTKGGAGKLGILRTFFMNEPYCRPTRPTEILPIPVSWIPM